MFSFCYSFCSSIRISLGDRVVFRDAIMMCFPSVIVSVAVSEYNWEIVLCSEMSL